MSVEHPEEIEPQDSETRSVRPKKIGGWLKFFCFQLTVLVPLFSWERISGVLQEADKIAHTYPQFASAIQFKSYGEEVIIIYGFLVGLAIFRGAYSGKRIATQYLILSFLGYAVVAIIFDGMSPANLPSTITDVFISGNSHEILYSGLYSIIWAIYFASSTRVECTYNNTRQAASTPYVSTYDPTVSPGFYL